LQTLIGLVFTFLCLCRPHSNIFIFLRMLFCGSMFSCEPYIFITPCVCVDQYLITFLIWNHLYHLYHSKYLFESFTFIFFSNRGVTWRRNCKQLFTPNPAYGIWRAHRPVHYKVRWNSPTLTLISCCGLVLQVRGWA